MPSIRKRPKENGGGYHVRYYGPDDRLRSKTFRTKAEAIDFSNKVEADIARGSWADPAQVLQRSALQGPYSRDWFRTSRRKRTTIVPYEPQRLPALLVPIEGIETWLRRTGQQSLCEWLGYRESFERALVVLHPVDSYSPKLFRVWPEYGPKRIR